MDNPLNGVLPDFSVFGVEFDALWKKVLGGIWAICIVITIIFLAIALAGMAGSSEGGGNALAYKSARTRAVWAGITLGCLAALAVIVGAILAIAG
ncbi:hypothetical protein HII28_19545 [Planctomonas sp. JC2975]|nr:hypothetical protein [Planctomonas sp. JC2975]